MTHEGIKPQPEKIQTILALKEPTNVKTLPGFLGMVQFYRDLWSQRSHILAPLTDLVCKCGHTKVTKNNGTKKQPLYWDTVHQNAFDDIKRTLVKEVMLSYPV